MIGNIVISSNVILANEVRPESKKERSWTSQDDNTDFVGFENHSGKTYLKKDAQPLGKVVKGFGNNGDLPAMQDGKALQAGDRTEGCIYKNAIGTYIHGSLLPKNPKLADWLLQKALEVKYGSPRFAGEAGKEIELEKLDDSIENQAHKAVISKIC